MNTGDSLYDQHGRLLRLLAEAESFLGTPHGVGWDDCVNCDTARFRAALYLFAAELRRHEAAETRALAKALDAPTAERRALKATYAKSHESLDHLVKLLTTAAAVDHGEHVYAVRSIATRVRQELEAHFDYEERLILPLIEKAHAR